MLPPLRTAAQARHDQVAYPSLNGQPYRPRLSEAIGRQITAVGPTR